MCALKMLYKGKQKKQKTTDVNIMMAIRRKLGSKKKTQTKSEISK